MVDELYVEAGKRIRKLRKSLGYSEEELSATVGITRKFLYEVETGKSGFSADKLFKIARALGVGCDYILMGVVKSDIEKEISETEKLLEIHYSALRQKMEKLRGIMQKESD